MTDGPRERLAAALAELPHAPPMRLVEAIDELEPGVMARAHRLASLDDWYFQGHFPGQPVVPAIALVELLAQTGGLAAHRPGDGGMRVASFTAFKFPAAAGPGVRLEAVARVVGRMGSLVKIEGEVHADSVLVAHGALVLAAARG